MSKELFAAIARGDLDEVAALLAGGASPNRASVEWPGWSPIEEAIYLVGEGGPVEMLVLLLRAGARLADWNEAAGGDHPFMVMVMSGNQEGTRQLLAAGADPNRRSSDGLSPLQWCAQTGDVKTAATLLRCGARATMNDPGGPRAMTALGQAAWSLDVPMVELLVHAGADPQARDLDDMTASARMPAREPANAAAYDEVAALLGTS